MTSARMAIARSGRAIAIGLTLALVALAACTSSEVALGPNDPGNPGAGTRPLASGSGALAPGFDDEDRSAPAAPEMHGMHHAMNGGGDMSSGAPGEQHGDAGEAKPSSQRWTCSMHPRIVRSGPGKCPICGMTLIPMPAADGGKQ